MVCAILFLGPALARLQGLAGDPPPTVVASLATPLPANGAREHYMRAALEPVEGSLPKVSPLPSQDSAMVAALARADSLIVRPRNASQAAAGDIVSVLPLS
ncbi:MAG: molybdopterin molybdenumtransferase MoeA, partial [Rhodospirillaceae bacterium]